ncbi:MAG: pyruvate kinase [Planctomycetes bacterium]|nr:pyruvate kinase [Planctomycetota bacterium]
MCRSRPEPEGASAPAPEPSELDAVLEHLDALRAEMRALEDATLARHRDLHPLQRPGARNLAHYVALRRHDLRDLQARLRRHGLSSLGRLEPYALATVDAVRRAIQALLGRPAAEARGHDHPVSLDDHHGRLEAQTEALFGPRPAGRRARLMVTLPTEAAASASLAHELVAAGMDVARVNCAHDDADAWRAMAAHVRAAAAHVGRPVRVLMDLAGPKLRTGDVAPGPAVVRWSPARDARGQTTRAARVWLSPERVVRPDEPVDAVLPVDREWLAALRVGEVVELDDLRGRRRRLEVVAAGPDGAMVLGREAAWVEPGTLLVRRRGDGHRGASTTVGRLPAAEGRIVLRRGDTLVLTRDPRPGRGALTDADGRVLVPAAVPCTLPEVFGRVKPGDPVRLDDGRIGGVARRVDADAIEVEIVHASPEGSRLGADKGVNLPDTRLDVPGLTPKDVEDFAVAETVADVVGLSFVDDPRDVRDLWRLVGHDRARPLGVVVKVETKHAFAHLPDVLLAAMEGHPVGVMIARGDLAVECGFERLAEVQEEILWMCEAAHVPVVWATQVLETMTKKGQPTRAEITDAAMSARAECVMLNKGPYVAEALRLLDDVLRRMQAHQSKKHALLRPLSISSLDEA